MTGFLLSTLMILAGASVLPSHAQELLWEPKKSPAEENKESINKNIELLQWEALTDTGRQFISPSDNRLRNDNITWEILPPPATERKNKNLSPDIATEANNQNESLSWEAVAPEDVIMEEEKTTPDKNHISPEKAIASAYEVIEQQSATFANDKALWRNDTWHPQISSLVPVGFGPNGTMLSLGMYGWDCIPATYGPCKNPKNLDEYRKELEQRGEAEWEGSIGLGNARHLVGLTITGMSEETGIQLGDRNNESENSRDFLSNYYIGMHLSRNLGIDTAARIGIKNWLDVREDYNSGIRGKSAYGVISQRIRLHDDQKTWFPNMYITAGLGNGEFRGVDQKFKASVAAQREAGCITYGVTKSENCSWNTRTRAGGRAVSYGELVPIGAIALEAYPGFNLIGEWNEGNLKAGFSVKPFKDIGLTFTSMWGSLLRNCDWGCNVSMPDVPGGVDIPDPLITERIKWSFKLDYNLKF